MPLPFRLTRSARRRRTVALRVLPDGSVSVRAPVRTSLSWIEKFIAARAGWIEKRRREMARRKAEEPENLENGSIVPFRGKPLRIEIAKGPSQAAASFREDEFSLRLSLSPGLSEADKQAEIRTELALWYKKKAREIFKERLAFWASAMGLTPGRLVLSAPRGRWGSCTLRNEIRLNWHLILAPEEILDYVVVHELAHLPHKNHGAAFWRLVERFVPDWKERRKRLKAWHIPSWLRASGETDRYEEGGPP